MAVCSCSELPDEAIHENVTEQEAVQVTRLTIGLHGAGSGTKLTYQESIVDGNPVMKTLWSEGDAITATPTPADESKAYNFNLKDGIGSGTGIFECNTYPNGYLPENFTSNAWTIYYPGGSIKGEQDYLDLSYLGQVQNGNGNTDHLKNHHSIRYHITGDNVSFNDSYIDLSGDNLDESSCMKFILNNLPEMTPVKIELSYLNEDGSYENLFHTHNYLTTWWRGATPNSTTVNTMSLDLEGFTGTTEVTAYMMLSNAPMSVAAGSRFKVSVTASDSRKYYCEKTIGGNVTITGGTLNTITCTEWTEVGNIDGFDNPADGIVVLQEATVGSGADIIIMGDGFSATETHFGASGDYGTIMAEAYADIFSVEPFKTLKPYFNVYYINAVSEDEHDAKPYTDGYGNQNGATQGVARTAFSTQFTPGSTSISGNNEAAISYAVQAIMHKGGTRGTACDQSTATTRANKALIMVMVNVACHAGTCTVAWTNDNVNDYGNAYSVAYTALNSNESMRRWTTIHEAGGHGFGKLADEYEGRTITSFSTQSWIDMDNWHSYGVYRNVNMYWGKEETGWSSPLSETYTTADNVYWSELLDDPHTYDTTEGLGVHRGGFTYTNLYCRPTANSIMRNQFGEKGQFFNAASRWAIWYRLMRLTGSTEATQFKNSLAEFIKFDKTLTITQNEALTKSLSCEDFIPTAPPVLIQGHWENGRFVTVE